MNSDPSLVCGASAPTSNASNLNHLAHGIEQNNHSLPTDPSMAFQQVPQPAEPTIESVEVIDVQPSTSSSSAGIAPTYDEVFPALPDSGPTVPPQMINTDPYHQRFASRMKVKSSNVTHVFTLASGERKYRDSHSAHFGEHVEQSKICAEIMQKTGTHIEMSNSRDGTLTFLITGKEDQVKQSKRLIAADLQTQASCSIPVSKEYHKFVLGKSGKKLSDLEVATGTKIYVPRQSDPSEQIKIMGTKDAIEKAAAEIHLISTEAASRSFERLIIPKEYHVFIIGQYSANINAIMSETGAKINIPSLVAQKDDISISGDKEAVTRAKERILAIFDERKKNCQTVSMEVKKAQHKYIIGPRGQSLQDIFDHTGVSVEMPPADSPNETITLRGEQEKLGPALTVLYDKAHSEIERMVDAEQWVQKHILGPKGSRFQELQRAEDFDKSVQITFDTNEDRIKIRGKRDEVERISRALENAVRQTKAAITVRELKVPPRYHRFIIGKNGIQVKQIREETGVQVHIPSETDHGQSSDVIRIEGSLEAVDRAEVLLNARIEKVVERENEVTKEMNIESRFHRQIIGSKGENIREIRERFNQVIIAFPEPSVKSDKVTIRGAKDDVERCCKLLSQRHEELLANNHRVEVPIFKQFHRFVIGKDGSTIKKIRDETDTKIELPDENSSSDVIIITGKKDNVHAAKNKIVTIQNDLADVIQADIIIPSKFHNSLIGAKGRLVRQIRDECGGVVIKFPPEGSNSDKVSIRGPKDCVTKAKQQLVELSNEKQSNDYSEELKVSPEHHRFLIGRNGSNIAKVREATGARVLFPSEKEQNSVEDSQTVWIVGKKENVIKAKAQLQEMVRKLEQIVEEKMNVPAKHHRHFVARRGALIRQINEEIGGKPVQISFPAQKEGSEEVSFKGSKEFIDLAKAKIAQIVEDLEAQVSIECPIEQQHHRLIMGTRGANVQGIQQQFNVHIKFPERATIGSNNGPDEKPKMNGDVNDEEQLSNGNDDKQVRRPSDIIVIKGRSENCEAAKKALLASIPVTEQVEVPFDYHRFIIGQKGREVRDLMESYDVSINVPPSSEMSNSVLVKGIEANVMKAKEALKQRVKKLDGEKSDREARSYREELRVAPEHHPKIIGRKGAVITKIRKNYDVNIQFPERGDVGNDVDLITLTGYEDKVGLAKKEIMRIVQELESLVTETVEIDARIRPRLIGARGKNIRKIMDTYKVDIRFPRTGEQDQDQVLISGDTDNVQDAKDHLLNLQEEYLDDVDEDYRAPRSGAHVDGEDRSSAGDSVAGGFCIKGGPWDKGPQVMPDTNDAEEFPSFAPKDQAPIIDPATTETPAAELIGSNSGKSSWGPKTSAR